MSSKLLLTRVAMQLSRLVEMLYCPSLPSRPRSRLKAHLKVFLTLLVECRKEPACKAMVGGSNIPTGCMIDRTLCSGTQNVVPNNKGSKIEFHLFQHIMKKHGLVATVLLDDLGTTAQIHKHHLQTGLE